MKHIRVGARTAESVLEVLDWLQSNVGELYDRALISGGVVYEGVGWTAKWRSLGAGWFVDVSIDDQKLAVLFSLRWE